MRVALLVAAAAASLLACGGDRPSSAAPDPPRTAASPPAPDGGAAPATGGAAGAVSTAPGDHSEADGAMTGALGVAFGSTRDEIVAKLGSPEFEQPGFEGIQQMGYATTVMGQKANVVFAVDRERGMTRAFIAGPVQDAGQCTLVLALWQHGLEQKYGPGRTNGTNAQTGCEQFAAQSRPWGESWKEARTGRRILLALMPNQAAVTLLYDTPEADAWERRKNASQL